MSISGASGLKQTIIESLSSLKNHAMMGAGAFKALGGFVAIENLYKLRDEKKKKNLSGEKNIIGDKVVYGSKIVSFLVIITLSAVATIIAFLASVIAAPILEVVQSVVRLVKNTMDLGSEIRREFILNNKIKEQDKLIHAADMDVNRNTALFTELAESQAQISELNLQYEYLNNQLDQVKGLKNTPDFEKLLNARFSVIATKIKANKAMLDSKMGNYFDGIKVSLKKLKLYSAEKFCLVAKLSAIRKELAALKSAEVTDHLGIQEKEEAIYLMNKEIEKVDGKIAEHEVLFRYNEKLKTLNDYLEQAKDQLRAVKAKYNNKPFDKLDVRKRKELEELERKYLDGRIMLLINTIEDIKDPEKRMQEITMLQSEENNDQKHSIDKATFLENSLNAEIENVCVQLKTKQILLNETEIYTTLFIGPKALKNTEHYREKIKQGFMACLEKANLTNQLKFKKNQKRNIKKTIYLGFAALMVGIVSCIPPVQVLLALVVIGNLVYEYKKKGSVIVNQSSAFMPTSETDSH